jgi:hypothetical protein
MSEESRYFEKLKPPYYKTWSKVSLGLKLMLSLLFTKGMTVTYSISFKPRLTPIPYFLFYPRS